MAYSASHQNSASTPDFARQNRLKLQTNSPLDSRQEVQRQSRQRASDKSSASQRNQGFRFLKNPYLQIQSSGSQTMGGNTMGNAQNLGNLSGKVTYSRNDAVGSNNLSDFYKFTLSKSSSFQVKLDKLTGNADLWLLKANGSRVSKSSRNGTKNERVRGNLRAGTYYVQVATEDNAASYSLNMEGSGRSTDAGNTRSAALDAGNLSRTQRRYRGQVGSSDSDDYYKVSLSEGGTLKANASGISGDIDLQIFNSNGAQIAKSTNTGSGNESISQSISAGTYFVRVSPFDNSQSNYTLDISSNYTGTPNSPLSPPDDPSPGSNPDPIPDPTPNPTGDPGNTLRNAEVKSSTFSRTQQVNQDDLDYYRFNVNQSGVFTANLTGLSGDADVRLIQDKNNNGSIDQGEVLAWQWEWGNSNESIRKFLNAGNYYLEVKGYGTSMKDYTLGTNFSAGSSDNRKFAIQINYKNGLENLGTTARNALEDAARYWENVVSHSSFNGVHNLSIDAVGLNSAQEWLAAATNKSGQADASGKWMPTTGEVRINTSYTSTYNNNPNYLRDVLIHEFGHVLGIGTLWEKNGRSYVDRNSGSYKADSYAGKAYGELLGTYTPTAIPVEARYFGHWDENKFQDELMTPYAERQGTKMPLSQITIASLRDIGWNVNYGAAETYTTNLAVMSPEGLQQDASTVSTPKCRCPLCSGAKEALGLDLVGSTSLSDAIAAS
ncbi:pre-peptidase C-terminal domain-containing protein [Phormidium tenue FACHB-886]|nr:pre-peptidase C-terminal domain-containing protein [Phormidium tenue FACHB-886]